MPKLYEKGQYSQIQGWVTMSMGNEGLLTLTVNVKVSPEPDLYKKL